MDFLFLALLVSALGVIPLLVVRRFLAAASFFVGATLLVWVTFYTAPPSFAWPFFGEIGTGVLLLWIVCFVINVFLPDERPHTLSGYRPHEGRKVPASFTISWLMPAVLLLTFGVRSCSGSAIFRANDYAGLLGEVEKREWTQDVQPKDPRHVRLVPYELAAWLADKQLGEASGAIGSQFQVAHNYMRVQMINDELWYVAPLDFKGFRVWSSQGIAPGYVMIHAEDPRRPVIVKTDEKFVFTPGAYFGKNLERHLWREGYSWKALTGYSLEIDDAGKAWWVVSVYKPTIAWWAPKVEGVAIVDPENGAQTFHAMGSIPTWVDRVLPSRFLEAYIDYRGEYHSGWWNAVWTHLNITEPEVASINYGSDGEPYWVTGQTSPNINDQSLVGIYYTHARTGKTVLYHAIGGTDEAIITAVGNKVAYKRWHGASPVLYNIYGHMTSVVPLLGENHTFQGVALVNVNTLAVAEGADQHDALREYQKELSKSGQQVAFQKDHAQRNLTGVVSRFAADVREARTTYYVHLAGTDFIFTGESEPWHELPLTREGDEVNVVYIESHEDVVPVIGFDNLSLELRQAPLQQDLRERVIERQETVADHDAARTARAELDKMSDAELRKIMEQQQEDKRSN